MSCLGDIQKCIHKSAIIEGVGRNFLEEKGTNTKVQLCTDGKYLLYDFEKIKQPLFPFFERSAEVKGLNSIADKVIFIEDSKDELWVFVIELKQNKGNPQTQLFATKLFVEFLLKSVNRFCKTNYKPKIRGIGYSKNYRPNTKPKNPYDKVNNAYVTGDKLILSNYLI